jgi:transcriptional regulator with XRE-family HTH domain
MTTPAILTPDQLRTRRIALGLRQADLARAAGLSQTTISGYECGEIRPGPDPMRRLDAVLTLFEQLRATIPHTGHARPRIRRPAEMAP